MQRIPQTSVQDFLEDLDETGIPDCRTSVSVARWDPWDPCYHRLGRGKEETHGCTCRHDFLGNTRPKLDSRSQQAAHPLISIHHLVLRPFIAAVGESIIFISF